jgi:HAMP domain-containing protein
VTDRILTALFLLAGGAVLAAFAWTLARRLTGRSTKRTHVED